MIQTRCVEAANNWAFADSEYGALKSVVLCEPSLANPFGEGAKKRTRAEVHVARDQLQALAASFRSQGVNVEFLGYNPHCPYQCYMRDSSVVTPWGLLICKMEFAPRSLESLAIQNFAESAGIPIWKSVEFGTLEGGDIQILRPELVVIGCNGGRTKLEGANVVRDAFEEQGWECRIFEYPRTFVHLDLVLGVLDELNLIVCKEALAASDLEWLEDRSYALHDVPIRSCLDMACNIVSLGNESILASATSQETNQMIRSLGYHVVEVDISEFVKDEGGVHCLTLPLLRLPG